MSRRAELEARRRALIERCDLQRAELGRRLGELRVGDLLGLAPLGAPAAGAGRGTARHPLAWVLAILAVLLLGRTREVRRVLAWARTALALAAGVAQVVRLVGSLRAARPRRAKIPPRRESEAGARARSAPG